MTEEDANVTTLRNAYGLWHDSKAGCAWRSRRSGAVVESPFAQFFRFANGTIARVVDTAAAEAAHAASPAS